MFSAVRWRGDGLGLLDQTLLPHREAWIDCASAADVGAAIGRLAVRGAPNIGIAAGYGVALEVRTAPSSWEPGVAALRAARPTAVNLAWAVDRVVAATRAAQAAHGPAAGPPAARGAAEALHAAENAASERVAAAGADLLAEYGARRVLTHCNTGVLACASGGSALGCAITHARATPGASVLACETRPLLQGARLTVWELERARVDHALLADGAAAGLIARGEIDAVIVGCDRVAANGDVANKVAPTPTRSPPGPRTSRSSSPVPCPRSTPPWPAARPSRSRSATPTSYGGRPGASCSRSRRPRSATRPSTSPPPGSSLHW